LFKLGRLDDLSIDASFLYLIAAPFTPEEARQAVLNSRHRKRPGRKCPARAR
jgi:hypothetical protein